MNSDESILASMREYPFSFWFSDSVPLTDRTSKKQFNVWGASAVKSVMCIGGLLSIFEEGWGKESISSFPECLREVEASEASELLSEAIDAFPPMVLENLDLRRQWAAGKARGSKAIPDLIERLQPLMSAACDTLDSAICTYIIQNIGEFPRHREWLLRYLQSGRAEEDAPA